ncbi:trichohyalin-like [Macrobrachium rosenbergii]|uniref:trichohyalin-like n=1 Tax=Macrobrachium rosenbergii TaxID=79674 RepID=UPI0034D423BC
MADSLDLELVDDIPNSLGASDFAVAIPGMALLASLAFAVYWVYTLIGKQDQDLEESTGMEDLEDSEDDTEMDSDDTDDYLDMKTDEEARLEDSLEMEQLDDTGDDLNMETDEEARLEDSLEVEQHEETQEEEQHKEEMCQEMHLSKQRREQMDAAEKRLEEDLHTCQVSSKIEHLWNEAKQEIELLRNQLMEKDLLLEKKAEEEKEMKCHFEKEIRARDRKIDNLNRQKEQLVHEKQQLEEDLQLALKQTENTNQLLKVENEDLSRLQEDIKKVLVEKDREVKFLKESLALRTKELEEDQEKHKTMKRRLMGIKQANVILQEKLRLTEADKVNILEDVLIMQDKHQALQSLLNKAESLMALGNELLNNERAANEVLEADLQVMEKGLAMLQAEKVKIEEELEEKDLDIISLEKALENEKKKNNILQPVLHQGKEMENLLERAKEREKEMEASLRSLEAELQKKNLQIKDFFKTKRELKCEEQELQDKLDIALHYGKELERMLKEAEEREKKMANDLEEQVQNRDDQIQDLLGREETLKSEMKVLRKKLENAVSHREKRYEKKYLRKKKEEEDRFKQTVYWMKKFWQSDDEVKKLRKEEEDHREQMLEMEHILANLREENQRLLRTDTQAKGQRSREAA